MSYDHWKLASPDDEPRRGHGERAVNRHTGEHCTIVSYSKNFRGIRYDGENQIYIVPASYLELEEEASHDS